MPDIKRPSFFLLSFEELQAELLKCGFEKYRARQIFDCVYRMKIFDPQGMATIPKKLRDFLSGAFLFSETETLGRNIDGDMTGKFLHRLHDGNLVECVLLEAPAEGGEIRKTLCVSTQVGCACGCRFCASTMRGFVRNLSAGEIISQALPFAEKGGKFAFENIVVMGMGGPLMNMDNLLRALSVFNDSDKFGFGARRITVSTCGIADRLLELAKSKFPYRLAISLHGATDEIRSKIMPINGKYPLSVLLPAAEAFAKSNGRMITLEYIMIDGVNDSRSQAGELAKIAKSLHAHVNLIPYNKVEGLEWRRPTAARRAAFAEILEKSKVSYTMRREKGSDINAACGQLALKTSDNIQKTP